MSSVAWRAVRWAGYLADYWVVCWAVKRAGYLAAHWAESLAATMADSRASVLVANSVVK